MKQNFTKIIRPALYILVVVLFVSLLCSQRRDLGGAVQSAREASPFWILLGCAMMALSVVCTSLVYQFLSPKKLRFSSTTLVQTSSLFVNKLLPAGSGALGISYLYLRANKVDKLSSTLVVILNNLFGFVGHALLLGVVLLLDARDIHSPRLGTLNVTPSHVWLPALITAIVVLLLLGLVFYKKIPQLLSRQRVRTIRGLLSRPRKCIAALAFSVLLTLCYVGCLLAAAAAVGVTLSLPTLLLVLTLSVLATVVLPVPGGIGAAEAGIFVALRAFNVPASDALLVAVLYRVITFWIPLGFGAAALAVVEKRHLIAHKI